MMSKKAYLQISFAWLFALVVGAFILFLAIFGASKLIGVGQEVQDAKTGKEIGILLNPLETSFETGKTTFLTMPVDTRIFNKCTLGGGGGFGRQIIQISQKSFGEWTQTNIDVGFSNKYIFSEVPSEGKKFYLFSKPFEFPFKVTDLIYITSADKNYCFTGNVPEEIADELSFLGQANLFVNNCTGLNPDNTIEVCFTGSGSGCDIQVQYGNEGLVTKNGKTTRFSGDALMYASIFSEPDLYECQLQRIMQRTSNLALLYKDKGAFVSRIECNSNLNSDLLSLSSMSKNLNNSLELGRLGLTTDRIKQKNDLANCKLF
ncbi:MAG: hypothetical protein ACE5ES_00800 [Candidatus Nanoarchaeia archaeon]